MDHSNIMYIRGGWGLHGYMLITYYKKGVLKETITPFDKWKFYPNSMNRVYFNPTTHIYTCKTISWQFSYTYFKVIQILLDPSRFISYSILPYKHLVSMS